MDFIAMHFISLIEDTKKGNECALTILCMITNYFTCIPLPDKKVDIVLDTFLKEVYY